MAKKGLYANMNARKKAGTSVFISPNDKLAVSLFSVVLLSNFLLELMLALKLF